MKTKVNLLSLFQIFDICLYFINDKERSITNFMLTCFIVVYSMGFFYWVSNIFIKMLAFDVSNESQMIYLVLLSFVLGVMLVRLIKSKRSEFYSKYSKLELTIATMWFKLVFAFVVVLTSLLNSYVCFKSEPIVILVYSLELIIIPYGFFLFAKTQDSINGS